MKYIIEHHLSKLDVILSQASFTSTSLLGGTLGLAYYYCFKYKTEGNKDDYQHAQRLLNEVIEQSFASDEFHDDTSFADGLAGVGYILSEIKEWGLLQVDLDKEFAKLDEFLFNKAIEQISDNHFDFLYGSMGILYYFVNRAQSPQVKYYIEECIKRLYQQAKIDSRGMRFEEKEGAAAEKKLNDLSLSHGLSGILLILINAYERGIRSTTIETIVKEGIRYMMYYKGEINFEEEKYSFFPLFVGRDTQKEVFSQRLGWCYGDLNQAILLYKASKMLADRQYKRFGDIVGTQSLLRKDNQSSAVSDVFFCHGSTGVAHFFRTLYEISGIESYYLGYEFWIEQTLILLDKIPDLDKVPNGLLEGLIGVAFTLRSYYSNNPVHWGKVLLL